MSASKRKGTAFESAVVEYLRAHGFPYAERRAMRGTDDRGDIAGVPGVVLECKATREIDLAGAVDEAEAEAERDSAWLAAAIIKRRRKPVGAAYVVLSLERFIALLEER